jgi:hypothetical protein
MGRMSPLASLLAMAYLRNASYGTNPYGNGSMSGGGYSGGGSGGGYGGGGSGGGYGGGNPYQNYASLYGSQDQANTNSTSNGTKTSGAYSGKSSQENNAGTILTALGLPNKDGHLDWPLGLRLLRPDEDVRGLRQQIDALIQVVATSSSAGSTNSGYVPEGQRAVEKLRFLMENERHSLSSGTYNEADRFLSKLESSFKNLDGR